MCAGGVLAVLLYGCESRCLTAVSVRRLANWLANWHNKRIREVCSITMLQTYVFRINSESLKKCTGVLSLPPAASVAAFLMSLRPPFVVQFF